MRFKAIIFDFDGVLFDSEKIHLQACNLVFQQLGFIITEIDYFEHYVGMSDYEMFTLIFNHKNIMKTPDQITALCKDKILAYQSIIRQSESLDGVRGVHDFLRSHAKFLDHIAICSGATRDEIDATLALLENGALKKYFKHITTIDDISSGKPSPEGYLLTAAKLDVAPRDCLVIEDTPIGITAAKAAGMTAAALTTTHHHSMLQEADVVADHYDDIIHWLE